MHSQERYSHHQLTLFDQGLDGDSRVRQQGRRGRTPGNSLTARASGSECRTLRAGKTGPMSLTGPEKRFSAVLSHGLRQDARPHRRTGKVRVTRARALESLTASRRSPGAAADWLDM